MSIPKGWVYNRLSDLVSGLEAGVSVNSEDRKVNKGEIGILKTSSVTYGVFQPLMHKTVLPKERNRVKTFPTKDSIIMSRMNTLELVGASAYINKDYPELFLPDRLWLMQSKKHDLSMKWLSYMLATPRIRYLLSGIATGTSGSMKNISKESVLNLDILVPSIEEQKKIAEILSAWDKAIGLYEKLIRKYHYFLLSLLEIIFPRRIRSKDEYTEASLDQLATIVMGQSPKGVNYNKKGEGLPLFQGNADIKNRESYPRNWTTEITKECFCDDILLSVRAPVGNVAISKHHGVIGRGLARLKGKDVSQWTLYYLLRRHESSWSRLEQGSTFSSIGGNEIKKFVVILPKDTKYLEQGIHSISSIDKTISILMKIKSNFIHQKEILMSQLLTGKKRVETNFLTENKT